MSRTISLITATLMLISPILPRTGAAASAYSGKVPVDSRLSLYVPSKSEINFCNQRTSCLSLFHKVNKLPADVRALFVIDPSLFLVFGQLHPEDANLQSAAGEARALLRAQALSGIQGSATSTRSISAGPSGPVVSGGSANSTPLRTGSELLDLARKITTGVGLQNDYSASQAQSLGQNPLTGYMRQPGGPRSTYSSDTSGDGGWWRDGTGPEVYYPGEYTSDEHPAVRHQAANPTGQGVDLPSPTLPAGEQGVPLPEPLGDPQVIEGEPTIIYDGPGYGGTIVATHHSIPVSPRDEVVGVEVVGPRIEDVRVQTRERTLSFTGTLLWISLGIGTPFSRDEDPNATPRRTPEQIAALGAKAPRTVVDLVQLRWGGAIDDGDAQKVSPTSAGIRKIPNFGIDPNLDKDLAIKPVSNVRAPITNVDAIKLRRPGAIDPGDTAKKSTTWTGIKKTCSPGSVGCPN